MGGLSLGHWAIVLLVIVLLFGRGRVSGTMEDFGKGIRNFRRGLTDEDKEAEPVEAIAAATAHTFELQKEPAGVRTNKG